MVQTLGQFQGNEGESSLGLHPPNVPLLKALRSLLDGIWGILKGSWGVLGYRGFTYGTESRV